MASPTSSVTTHAPSHPTRAHDPVLVLRHATHAITTRALLYAAPWPGDTRGVPVPYQELPSVARTVLMVSVGAFAAGELAAAKEFFRRGCDGYSPARGGHLSHWLPSSTPTAE